MKINLIDILRNSFSDKSYQDISQHVGINLESTKNGLNAITPIVLASVLGNNTVKNATQPVWWNALKEEYPFSEDEDIETIYINSPSFLIKGREVISGMFRTNHDELVSSISSIAGIQKEKASGLIEVGVPLIAGYLNNWVRKKGWKFKDLIENLDENKPSIIAALPSGISPARFGMGNVPKDNFSKTIETAIPTKTKSHNRVRNGFMWLFGLIVIALLLWYFMGK